MNAQTLAVSNADQKNERRQEGTAWWFVLPTLTVVWVGIVGIGLSWMIKYEATPGQIKTPLADWPADCRVTLNSVRPTLIMFAHPRCPCTRATISELALLMAHCPERVDVQVLFFRPSVASPEWEKTDLWFSAEAIPGVKVGWDQDGSEATRFCATTSGYALLYDPNGRLLFDGGITGSRGHSGDNAGRSAIESLLLKQVADQKRHAFVFGCPLRGPDHICVTRDNE